MTDVWTDVWKVFAVTGEYNGDEEDEGNTNNNANTRYDDDNDIDNKLPKFKSSEKYQVYPKPLTGQLVLVVYGDQGKTGVLPMAVIGDQPSKFVSGQTIEFQVKNYVRRLMAKSLFFDWIKNICLSCLFSSESHRKKGA